MNQQSETTANNEAITVLTQLHGSQIFKDVAAAKQEIARIKEEFNVELPPVYDEYLAAVSAFREDRLPESSDRFESCLSLLDDKQHVLSAYCCVYLGTIYSIGREYHHALRYFAQAENTRREHDHKLAQFLHVNRSAIYIMLDDYEKALEVSEKAVEHGKHLEAPATYGLALCNLAVAQAKLSLLDEALLNIEEAVEYSDTHKFARAFGYAQCYHAYITGLTGDLKKASILYKKAFEEIKKLDDTFLRIEFYQYYSAFLYQCGQYSFAIQFCSGALSGNVLDSNTKAQAAIYTVLADCHRELGQLDEEVKYLRTLNTLNRGELKRSEQNEVHYID
ncbi:hypothetical protein L4C33_15160, partial [Vibrio makurazakiensis]|uniref:hypothetical protein n=1 Tax=Vibrio makurazakiensis TaxID=2910250 RepID=UPI003D10B860